MTTLDQESTAHPLPARTQLVDWETERKVVDFLLFEAQLLDGLRFDEWIELLASDISYLVPVRATRPPGQGSEFSPTSFHFEETLDTLRLRVARLKTGHAWAEVPPSRTRHFLTNFRVSADPDRPDTYVVESNLLLTRIRGDESTWQMLSGRRLDRVRGCASATGFELAHRSVFLDVTTLTTYNLAFFL
jgi:3-phenylpropionate/cinnamic acid dioxygenase small subunit